MADNIILGSITFHKIDNDGNLIVDKNGNEKVFELKDFVDCSWICEGTENEHLIEKKEESPMQDYKDNVLKQK